MKPLLFYGLNRDELASIGHMMITYAQIDSDLNHLLDSLFMRAVLQPGRRVLDASRFFNMAPRIAALKTLVKGCDDRVQFLTREFRVAMKIVVPARNLIAHGIILDAGMASAEFRSMSKDKGLSVDEVLRSVVWFDYALHMIAHADWSLRGIKAELELPDRPV